MSPAALVAVLLVVAWAALVVAAQLLNPEQSPLSMGMSGLARGQAPWVMKASFLCRGASALLLLIDVPGALHTGGLALAGMAAFWIWGVGSAALSLVDTDMPGEPPSRSGAAHVLVALVAYVAGVLGAVLLSVVVMRELGGTSLAVWALPLALTAAAALAVQFVAFGAAAREARASAPAFATPASQGTPASVTPASPGMSVPAAAVISPPPAAVTAPAVPPPLGSVPPQLSAAGPARPASPPVRRATGGAAGAINDLAGYAGLFQRVFLALLMLWTLIVALGIGST